MDVIAVECGLQLEPEPANQPDLQPVTELEPELEGLAICFSPERRFDERERRERPPRRYDKRG